jgi:outer membrane protein TolC
MLKRLEFPPYPVGEDSMHHGARIRWILLFGLCAALVFAGGACSPSDYKAQADKEVYKIIDAKWQDDFGGRANYKVSDVAPSPNDVRAEGVTPQKGVLTLAQAVAIATAQNREYQRQKEQLYLAALDLTLARHQFARQWFGTVDAGYVRDSSDESVESGGEVGFSQMLADGAMVTASISLDWARFLTGDPRTSLGSFLSARVAQPLLRGSGRKVAQEQLTQAERNALYQIRSFNRYRQDFVVSVIDNYYRVLQQADSVANAKNSYESKLELLKRLEMEADEGRTARFQVDQAEQSKLNAWDSYVRAQQSYEQRLDEFKITLSLPVDANVALDPNELKALADVGITELDYMPEDAVATALASRLDLANSRDAVEDADRKVVVAADNLGVELNLVGSVGVPSTEATDFDRLQFHRGTYRLGLESPDLPLDRKAQRNAYREALIALEQRRRQYENDVDSVELEVRQAYRRLQEEAESYKTQKQGVELAEKRVAVSPLLWEAQRANTRDLLESQDALQRARNSLTAALVDHTIAKLTFFRDIGILQVRPDGMWERGAQ